ncbi:Crp/Fnr family transcriptional regulator [Ruminococcaceae bacterium OttesenSCG-928-I18]|nr:Crp/Fnr family transcriptional regulator [Ruminococcaceae bacterium OttesenSCG-928-I18]
MYEDLLLQAPLFAGMDRQTLRELLLALRPQYRAFGQGEALLMAGTPMREIGVLLEGLAEARKITPAGREFMVTRMAPGGVYGDVLFGSDTKSPVTIQALSACKVMLLGYPRFFSAPVGATGGYTLFLQNLLRVISEKYFALDARVDLLLTHGLRRRIADWLLMEAKRQGSYTFSLPFTRAEMASYLGCERSALSRELSRMAAEGLIETKRGHFRLLAPDALQENR